MAMNSPFQLSELYSSFEVQSRDWLGVNGPCPGLLSWPAFANVKSKVQDLGDPITVAALQISTD
jgi:hypothetical protein